MQEKLLYEIESLISTLRDDMDRLARLRSMLESRSRHGYADVTSWLALTARLLGLLESIAESIRRGEAIQASVAACEVVRLIHQVEVRASTSQASLWMHLYEELFRIPLALAREASSRLCGG